MKALTPEGRGHLTADERTQAPPLQLSTAWRRGDVTCRPSSGAMTTTAPPLIP